MEPVTLAAAAVALLGPYLGKLGENAGDATSGAARRLYEALKARFRDDAYAEPILEGAVQRPDSKARLAALEGVIAEVAEEDPAFAAEIGGHVGSVQSVVDSGAVAGRDLAINARYAAGRDLHINTDD